MRAFDVDWTRNGEEFGWRFYSLSEAERQFEIVKRPGNTTFASITEICTNSAGQLLRMETHRFFKRPIRKAAF